MPMGEEGQREFLEKTGIDLERDIDYVVAAAMSTSPDHKAGMVVARGRFDVVKLESLARDHGAQVQEYKGKRLLTLDHTARHDDVDKPEADAAVSQSLATSGNKGVLAFLEPGLVAIGDLRSVKRAIDAQLSAQSITSNNEMMDLVSDVERSNNAWAVGRFDQIANQAKLPDEIARRIPPIKWFCAAANVNGGLSAQLRADTTDEQAAENLRGVVNGIISLARLQGQNDPKIAPLIQSFQMSGSGKSVQLHFTIPTEIFELMASKVKAPQ
jgi:hypothetical protein